MSWGKSIWGILKGMGLGLLCNLGLLVLAGLCALDGFNFKQPIILVKFGTILAEWIGLIQLAYLAPIVWRLRQSKKAMALGLIFTILFTAFFNFLAWESNRETEAAKPKFSYEYVHHASESDLVLNYQSFQKQGEGATGRLEALFQPDSKTGVDLSQVGDCLSVTFSKPAYVKEFQFTVYMPSPITSGPVKPRLVFYDSNDADMIEYFDYSLFPLNNNQTIVTLDGKGRFFGILRSNAFNLELKMGDINKKYEAYRASPVILTGLKVIYTDHPALSPTLKIQDIEKSYVKDRKYWYFDGWFENNQDPGEAEHLKTEDEVMRSLMVLGLEGDKRAEELFKNYQPPESDIGEWHSGLVQWYDKTKEENKQLK